MSDRSRRARDISRRMRSMRGALSGAFDYMRHRRRSRSPRNSPSEPSSKPSDGSSSSSASKAPSGSSTQTANTSLAETSDESDNNGPVNVQATGQANVQASAQVNGQVNGQANNQVNALTNGHTNGDVNGLVHGWSRRPNADFIKVLHRLDPAVDFQTLPPNYEAWSLGTEAQLLLRRVWNALDGQKVVPLSVRDMTPAELPSRQYYQDRNFDSRPVLPWTLDKDLAKHQNMVIHSWLREIWRIKGRPGPKATSGEWDVIKKVYPSLMDLALAGTEDVRKWKITSPGGRLQVDMEISHMDAGGKAWHIAYALLPPHSALVGLDPVTHFEKAFDETDFHEREQLQAIRSRVYSNADEQALSFASAITYELRWRRKSSMPDIPIIAFRESEFKVLFVGVDGGKGSVHGMSEWTHFADSMNMYIFLAVVRALAEYAFKTLGGIM